MDKQEFNALYLDKLILLSIDKCLNLHKEYFRSKEYDEHYAQGEIIDFRNKHIEGCLDKVFKLHSVFDEEFLAFKI